MPAWSLAVVVAVSSRLLGQLSTVRRRGPRGAPKLAGQRPNIVFVLTDDLSMNLLPYMPHVQAMERSGLTFTNYFVSDSLCCPSRASIFTGNFPHDTNVFTNVGRQGGFNVFHKRGEEHHTFAVALHERRLPNRIDGEVPQPLHADPVGSVHLRAARMVGLGRYAVWVTESSTTR